MPWSGSTFTRSNGVYTGSTVWQTDKANGVLIVSSRHDTHDQDLADGINACIKKDGANAGSGFAWQAKFNSIGTPSVAYTFTSNATTVNWGNTNHATIQLPNTATTQTINFTAPTNPGLLCLRLTGPASGTTPPLFFSTLLGACIPATVGLTLVQTLLIEWDGTNFNLLAQFNNDNSLTGTADAFFNGKVTAASATITGQIVSNSTTPAQLKTGVAPGTIFNAGANPATINWNNGFVQYGSFNATYGAAITLSNLVVGVNYKLLMNNTDTSSHNVLIAVGGPTTASITVAANNIAVIDIVKVGNFVFPASLASYSNSGFVAP